MKKGMIITLPRYDDATDYLSYYSKEIITNAKDKNLKVKEVKKERELCMKEFSNIVKKLDYNLIVLNGHGSSDSVFGHKDNVLIEIGKNEDLIKEKLTYARSCHAGLTLGPECMKNSKSGCFIGYEFPFVFFMDPKWSVKPHNDKVARLFLMPSNLIPISLIKGNSAMESNEKSKKQILKNVKEIIKNKSEPGANLILEGLWYNFKGQIVLGNGSAKV